MEIRDLRWAIATSQHRSLRQAAAALGIRQPTLSRGLRDLELRLGVVLFERTNGGTRPTGEGQEFLDAAYRIVAEVDGVFTRLGARARGESGKLAIGVHASLSAGNLRATLVEHHTRRPGVEIELVDGSSDRLISDLINSTIDIAFLVEPPAQVRWDERSLPVWSERAVIALPNDHPLTLLEIVRWEDLRGETILVPKSGTGPELVKLLATKTGCPNAARLKRHDASLDRLLTMVGATRGILLALEGATGAVYPGVQFREIHGPEGATRLNFRAFWREANSNPSLGALLEILRERYPDFSAADGAP